MSLGQRVIQQDALYLDQTKCTFSFFYRQNEVCVSCESLTLIMNLHSFVWEKKNIHTFLAGNSLDLSICTGFQRPAKVEN